MRPESKKISGLNQPLKITVVPLEPCRDQLEVFADAIFRRAGTEGFISVRSFHDTVSKTFRISAVPRSADFRFLIDAVVDDARRAAQFPKPIVFAPPPAIFKNNEHARDEDVIEGLTISVECDAHPQEARVKLETILGPATLWVRSGGIWINEDGQPEDKLHGHWRLQLPAGDAEGLAKLRLARELAARLVGADASGAAVCHPYRWPGSWHRKGEPRLCITDTCNPGVEVDLDVALAALQAAAPQVDGEPAPGPHEPLTDDEIAANRMPLAMVGFSDRAELEFVYLGSADPEAALARGIYEDQTVGGILIVRAAVRAIPNEFQIGEPSYKFWIEVGMSIYYASYGRNAGYRFFDGWSQRSTKYHFENTVKAWRSFKVAKGQIGFRRLCWLASQANLHWDAEFFANDTCDNDHAGRQSNGAGDSPPQPEPPPQPPPPPPQPQPALAGDAKEKGRWPRMDSAAYYGFAGEVVETISPHSEADPVALLVQFLVIFGNIIGRWHYFQVESDRHFTNLFQVLVGATRQRKNTALNRILTIVKSADEVWKRDRIRGGLSSGEGLIEAVRDGGSDTDPGVGDKRLLIIEPEFAGVLAVSERPGNTINPLLRKAWDGAVLETLTRKAPLRATDTHISVIGHITEDELRARLTRTDMANGFANRFLFTLVKRSKELPFGGDLTDSQILDLGERLKQIIDSIDVDTDIGAQAQRSTMTEAARAEWAKLYSALSADQPGLLGAVIGRGEPQTLRLALIYSLLDRVKQVDVVHLKAALAVWNYCEASARHIFGQSVGDEIADAIRARLRGAGERGLSRTSINQMFFGHKHAARISLALDLLVRLGLAKMETRSTGGRPLEVWLAI
jgi:Protein of unknown function (DUF3987)/Primase C terminal 2 (PriCT-2)